MKIKNDFSNSDDSLSVDTNTRNLQRVIIILFGFFWILALLAVIIAFFFDSTRLEEYGTELIFMGVGMSFFLIFGIFLLWAGFSPLGSTKSITFFPNGILMTKKNLKSRIIYLDSIKSIDIKKKFQPQNRPHKYDDTARFYYLLIKISIKNNIPILIEIFPPTQLTRNIKGIIQKEQVQSNYLLQLILNILKLIEKDIFNQFREKINWYKLEENFQ